MYLSHTNKKAPAETIVPTGAFINKKTPVEEDFNRSYQLYGIAFGELHRRKVYNYKLNILCTLLFVNQNLSFDFPAKSFMLIFHDNLYNSSPQRALREKMSVGING